MLPSTVHIPLESSRILRSCYHCRRPQDATVQLKKCAGCRIVEYCSKECQKASWPRHKPICGTNCKILGEKANTATLEVMVSYHGFKTISDATEAFKVFLQAHRWAINVHATTSLRRKQGFNPAAGDVEDWVFMGTLQCLTTSQSRKRLDPASAFRLVGERFVPMDEFKDSSDHRASLFEQWSGPQREATTEMYKSQPRFFGTYPVVYKVGPMGLCTTTYYPFNAPNPAILSLDEDKRHEVLDDLNSLAKERPLNALPGRFVRSNKIWTWEPMFADWEAYMAADPRPHETVLLDDAIARLKSGIPIAKLFPWGHMI
ncbi:hypothetical protein LXA43DRAFT_1043426 [Ganoderma leucocontextum]|nr:hypothetical protein LXA43DRAFT_1043426 [Ganoderma leucocontextum]